MHDERRARFLDDGFVHCREVLDPAWQAVATGAIERGRRAPGPFHGVLSTPGEPLVDSDLFRWFADARLASLLFQSPLADLACELLGTDTAVLVEDQWFASDPGARTPSPWHQDDPYYRIDRPFLTLWCALDDAPAATSLRMVAGSHRWGRTFAPVEFSSSSVTIGDRGGLVPVPDVDRGNFDVRGPAVAAGDVIALDSRTLHATGVEPVGERPFRRLSTRWAHPDARYVDRGPQVATFWDELDHGLRPGDALACATFPVVHRSTSDLSRRGR